MFTQPEFCRLLTLSPLERMKEKLILIFLICNVYRIFLITEIVVANGVNIYNNIDKRILLGQLVFSRV